MWTNVLAAYLVKRHVHLEYSTTIYWLHFGKWQNKNAPKVS